MSDKTTELREKLMERGVKYRTTEVHGMPVTLFDDGILTWSVTDHPDGYMILNCGGLTPEQAIAATLGSDAKPCYATDLTHDSCKYSVNRGWIENATLESGECELVETESYSNAHEVIHVLECSACGETCEHVNGAYPRCPHCGAHAKDAGTTREAADDSGHAYSDDDDDDWYY